MRVGFLTNYSFERLDWAARHGFGSVEWIGFDQSPAGPREEPWQAAAEKFLTAASGHNIRISAIGALYANPLDPEQKLYAAKVFRRAIEVAAHLKVKTVAGFAGAPLYQRKAGWGGHLVYEPFENYLDEFRAFWEPLARLALDKGVRIAFEHCPTGPWNLPVQGFNLFGRVALWERLLNDFPFENIGLEWDPSHLICLGIDPVQNIHHYGSRIFHVHAKDAFINKLLLERYGFCHDGVAEHRFPGLGQADWGQIIHALLRVGYDSDLNIEGWHDPVFRDHEVGQPEDRANPTIDYQRGQKLEDAGLLLAKDWLKRYLPRA